MEWVSPGVSGSLLAKIATGELDEDGLKAGFGDGEIAEAVRICLADNVGEKAVCAFSENTDAFGSGLCAGHSGKVLKLLDQGRDVLMTAQEELVYLLCAD